MEKYLYRKHKLKKLQLIKIINENVFGYVATPQDEQKAESAYFGGRSGSESLLFSVTPSKGSPYILKISIKFPQSRR